MVEVAAWKLVNPLRYRGSDEYAPYPLTPGSDPVGSNKCFDCGVCHPGGQHVWPPVDKFKSHYRAVANRIIMESHKETPSVIANVHFITATPDYPAHYIEFEEQGNREGPVG